MQDEYDFTGAQRGKFYRPGAILMVRPDLAPLPAERERTLAPDNRDPAPSTNAAQNMPEDESED